MTASDQQQFPPSHAPTDAQGFPLAARETAARGPVDPHLLQQLADAHGVGTSFQGWDGLPHSVAEDTLIKVLASL
ncbi:MAG: malQ, partial [Pseudarthrobacter sp.]|nr:malQ [Pseudarthrobacter sp.]